MYAILPRILCVDDEPHVLEGMARNLRRSFDVTVAPGGEAGLSKIVHEGPFAVVVSDQRMPGMDGVTFLSNVRQVSPDTVRILLTGYADTNAAIAAVNQGAVFRFLTKPIEVPDLHQSLMEAVGQHRSTTAERVVLERTLHGSIQALTEMLALLDPVGHGRVQRAKQIVTTMADRAGAPDVWLIEIATMLAQVGSGSPTEAGAPGELAPAAAGTVERLAKIADDVMACIPRVAEIRVMLSTRMLNFDGSNGKFGDPKGIGLPLGARMMRIALDLDQLEAAGMARAKAVDTLRGRTGSYDPHLLESLAWSGPAAATGSYVGQGPASYPGGVPRADIFMPEGQGAGMPRADIFQPEGHGTVAPRTDMLMPSAPTTGMFQSSTSQAARPGGGLFQAPAPQPGADSGMIQLGAMQLTTPAAPRAKSDEPSGTVATRTLDIELRTIAPGMTLLEDVRTSAGRVLIGRGEQATRAGIDLIKRTLDFGTLRQSVRVSVTATQAESLASGAGSREMRR